MAERGSERLLRQSNLIEKEQLAKIVELSERYGKILDWCWFGQPGIDGFCGTVRVDLDSAGRIVQELLTIDHPRIIVKGFPHGIPVPDEVLLDIGTHAGGFR
jgi:hypothetical protein